MSQSILKRLRSLRQKKNRQKTGRFIIEGAKIVNDACTASSVNVHQLVYTDDYNHKESLNISEDLTLSVSDREMKTISSLKTPPGILAEISLEIPKPASGGSRFYLDAIRDPGNLGTIIRIADWYGMPGIIVSPDCVDALNEKVVQSSMSSLFRVHIRTMSREDLIANYTDIIVADLNGTSHRDLQWSRNAICVIGNEANGPHSLFESFPKVSILGNPLGAESLNAAVATAVLADQWMQRI